MHVEVDGFGATEGKVIGVWMRHCLAKFVWFALLTCCAATQAPAQTADSAGIERTATERIATERIAEASVVREIRDPHTGIRWLLQRDSLHPGGPGRMSLLTETNHLEINSRMVAQAGSSSYLLPRTPVIRGGDRLIIEEHSAVVDAQLEAVALSPVVEGAEFFVRLSIGGKVVRAIALGRGRAAFATDAEKKR
jgi:hypothetical protein